MFFIMSLFIFYWCSVCKSQIFYLLLAYYLFYLMFFLYWLYCQLSELCNFFERFSHLYIYILLYVIFYGQVYLWLKVHAVEKNPSMSEVNEILLGQVFIYSDFQLHSILWKYSHQILKISWLRKLNVSVLIWHEKIELLNIRRSKAQPQGLGDLISIISRVSPFLPLILIRWYN